MGKNKELEKFKGSKIPKKGEGKANEALPIYEEPNTNSKIIGSIEKGQKLEWISKSICQGFEWVRCGGENSFGYTVGSNIEGKYNIDTESISEKKKKEFSKEKESIKIKSTEFTKDEIVIGDQAYKQVMQEKSLSQYISREKIIVKILVMKLKIHMMKKIQLCL